MYNSILHTLVIMPKKKHFKKLLEYIKRVEPVENVTPLLIDKLIEIGIESRYPVTVGRWVRDIQSYPIHRSSFMKFVMFLERSKGYEEDAKKFLLLT